MERHREVVKKIKDCIGMDDYRVIQTKNFDIMWAWTKLEAKKHNRRIVSTRVVETNLYAAISLPNTMKSKEFRKLEPEIRAKLICFYHIKDVHIIETNDVDMLTKWTIEETKKENRVVSASPNNGTDIYTATSISK
jgi:hypothetical protein